ncbi:hypothetical protein T02_751 [Trichinella nativa]|uniref:Uncharacterized protein n=1 Tax=Trichinella nativa TaxID=6335 RepID=A0A0V1KQL0_9BILA|nr:hypothetical protein T02_751 [Trichinella nativa]
MACVGNWRVTRNRQEAACLSVISVLCCVIILGVRVDCDQCTFVPIDKRSPSLNKAGFHCLSYVIIHYTLYVRERTSVVTRPLTRRRHASVANILVL